MKTMVEYVKPHQLRVGNEILHLLEKADEEVKRKQYDANLREMNENHYIFQIIKPQTKVTLHFDIEKGEMALHSVEKRIDKELEVISIQMIEEFLKLIKEDE